MENGTENLTQDIQEEISSGEETSPELISDVYTMEILPDIYDAVDLQNHILSGQIFFTGLFTGIILLKIFWDRFSK